MDWFTETYSLLGKYVIELSGYDWSLASMSLSSSEVFHDARSGGGSDADFVECIETSEDVKRLECLDTNTPIRDGEDMGLVANNSFRKR